MDYYGKQSISNNNNNNNNNSKLLPIILLVASAAAIAAMFILQFFGVYFFFFFLPLTFSLPWSIKRLWGRKARKQWNVEDLRQQIQKSSLSTRSEEKDPFPKIRAISSYCNLTRYAFRRKRSMHNTGLRQKRQIDILQAGCIAITIHCSSSQKAGAYISKGA